MLCRDPACTFATVTTTGSNTSNVRVTIVCSDVIISAIAVIGSRAVDGDDPCPPAPRTVTVSLYDAASSVPALEKNRPCGFWQEKTCMP